MAASFLIDGSALESKGLFKVVNDTYGQQTVSTIYGLLTFGLACRVDEIWASMAFATPYPITSWAGTSLVTTSWASTSLVSTSWSGTTLPSTSWTGTSIVTTVWT